MPCAGGTSRGKCLKLQTLWTRTDCSSKIAVLLWTWIIGQDPWTDMTIGLREASLSMTNYSQWGRGRDHVTILL